MRPLLSLLLLAALAAAGWWGVRWLEANRPQDLPWTPLEIEQPVGLFTATKLAALKGDKDACLALFARSPLAVVPVEDRRTAPSCGYVDAVALERMTAAYDPGTVRIACPLAAALAIWETQVMQPAARRLLGAEVSRIDHFGTYACRRLYGAAETRWSAHATAEAIDIAGFVLADGTRISLASDWGADSPKGAFLAQLHGEGCGLFGTLLGPAYNAAHRDHFHMEAGRFGLCR